MITTILQAIGSALAVLVILILFRLGLGYFVYRGMKRDGFFENKSFWEVMRDYHR